MIGFGSAKRKMSDRRLSQSSVISFREGVKSNKWFRLWFKLQSVTTWKIEVYDTTHISTGYVNLVYVTHHVETNQLICKANQLIGFYILGTMVINTLIWIFVKDFGYIFNIGKTNDSLSSDGCFVNSNTFRCKLI